MSERCWWFSLPFGERKKKCKQKTCLERPELSVGFQKRFLSRQSERGCGPWSAWDYSGLVGKATVGICERQHHQLLGLLNLESMCWWSDAVNFFHLMRFYYLQNSAEIALRWTKCPWLSFYGSTINTLSCLDCFPCFCIFSLWLMCSLTERIRRFSIHRGKEGSLVFCSWKVHRVLSSLKYHIPDIKDLV